VAFPALVDRGDTVAVELWDYPSEASVQHRLGVLRLLRLSGVQTVKYLRKQLLRGNEFNLVLAGGRFDRNALVEDLIDAAYSQTIGLEKELPYSEADFHRMEKDIRGEIVGRANDIEAMLFNVLKQLAALRQKLAVMEQGKWLDTREDIAAQLAFLLGTSFLRDTPAEWLAQYPRYLKALLNRVERLAGQYPKDQKYTQSLDGLTQPLRDVLQGRPNLLLLSDDASTYRWMLEEFRVSLFAQNLGTRLAVSQKRLVEHWVSVDQWLNQNPH
jgi:ATP-dependent helicase HrpA